MFIKHCLECLTHYPMGEMDAIFEKYKQKTQNKQNNFQSWFTPIGVFRSADQLNATGTYWWVNIGSNTELHTVTLFKMWGWISNPIPLFKNGYNYLSMLGLKLYHVSKRGHWEIRPSICLSLQWRHNGRDIVSNHQPHDCLLNRLFRRR